MTDYSRLRVVDLKAELKKRGLPQSGLKDALIERLRKADEEAANEVQEAQAAEVATAPEAALPELNYGEAAAAQALADSSLHDASVALLAMAEPAGREAPEAQPTEAATAPEEVLPRVDAGDAVTSAIHTEPSMQTTSIDRSRAPEPNLERTESPQVVADARVSEDRPEKAEPSAEPVESIERAADQEQAPAEVGPDAGFPAAQRHDAEPSVAPESETAEAPERLTMGSLRGEAEPRTSPLTFDEAASDARKRKRRSRSPTLSSEEVAQKRVKQSDEESQVEGPTDVEPQVASEVAQDDVDQKEPVDSAAQPASDQVNDAMEVDEKPVEKVGEDVPEQPHTSPAAATSGDDVAAPVSHDPRAAEDDTPEESSNAPPLVPQDADSRRSRTSSPSRQPASAAKDGRFKDLFQTRQANERTSSPAPDSESRDVEPAIHSATSALYIRELMRPLQPATLKDHLVALASPPRSSPDPSIVTEFYLDPIRTHCLVSFASVSAASRVRSALHQAVWPEERARKPLWADFIPEDKVREWIEIETSETGGPSGRALSSKRWEVVYQPLRNAGDEVGGVLAVFQEVGAGGPTSGPGHGGGVRGAPQGPRRAPIDRAQGRDSEQQQQQQQRPGNGSNTSRTSGSGFNALDSLFRSTTAKPKLYFQPVPEALAQRRLSAIAKISATASSGGHRRGDDEMRRYTFEDGDFLVDAGPERDNGFRGGGNGPYRPRDEPSWPRAYGRGRPPPYRRDRW